MVDRAQDDSKMVTENAQAKKRVFSKKRMIKSAMPSRQRSKLEKDRYKEDKDKDKTAQLKTMDDTENANTAKS